MKVNVEAMEKLEYGFPFDLNKGRACLLLKGITESYEQLIMVGYRGEKSKCYFLANFTTLIEALTGRELLSSRAGTNRMIIKLEGNHEYELIELGVTDV